LPAASPAPAWRISWLRFFEVGYLGPRSDAPDAPKLEAVIVDLSAARGRENDRKHVNAAEMPSEPSAAAEREQSTRRLTRASRLGDLVQIMAVNHVKIDMVD
jgi:hypothetical protein